MKKFVKQSKGLIKGRSTAFLVSVGIHAVLLFVAGTMVVFHVVKKKEKVFEPPVIEERKIIDLKKPTVKVDKKQSRPKPSKAITSKNVQTMSDFQLPNLPGMGEGLGGGLAGIELMPDIDSMSILGAKEPVSVGNDFVGTFYDLDRTRDGRINANDGESRSKQINILRRFYESGWNENVLAEYWRSPQKLYTTFFFLPMISAAIVPRSFGVPDEVYSEGLWMVHFKGQFAAKESGRYRFWARGEDVCDIRVNGKIVVLGGHFNNTDPHKDLWMGHAPEHRKYYRGHGRMAVGDWFELEAGVPADFEIVFSDSGAWTQSTVTIEKEGEYYARNEEGAPILPVFKTAEIPEGLKNQMKYRMMPKDLDGANLDSPLMFNIY